HEVSTLRRHMQSRHKGAYIQWCKKNNFTSMLPNDVKARKKTVDGRTQSRLDKHLREQPPKQCTVPYSDEVFNEAAHQWLIETDQPIQALQHPSFKSMIDIAARATEGVRIDDLRNTREAIINTFKRNMTRLRDKLNVRICISVVKATAYSVFIE
ncbi:hypothetical protein LXA43DRAFT_906527, partial [Ganoderma leucocontextum]